MSMWILPNKPSHEHPQTRKEMNTKPHILDDLFPKPQRVSGEKKWF